MKTYKIHFFGEIVEVHCVKRSYYNGTLAIEVLDNENEPFGVLTVNLNDALRQNERRAYVKDYSENEGWARELADQIGRYTGHDTVSGFCAIPLYEFDLERL